MNIIHHRKIMAGLAYGISLIAIPLACQANSYCTDEPVDGAIYKIINVGSGKLLAAESDSINANIEQETNTGLESQRFYLNYQSSSHYWSIQATNTNYAASVQDESTSNGATVEQQSFDGSDHQEWELKQVASGDYEGAYKIVNHNSSYSLTVAGSTDGSDIYQNQDTGVSSQRWWLEPVNVSCSGSDSGGNDGSDSSSSAAAPTASAAKSAGANSEPQTNGYPSFIKNTVSNATVVSSLSALLDAIDNANAGDVIYLREGTYSSSSTIDIENNGSSSNTIVLSAYPGDDHPVFNFSSMSENSSNRGFEVSANYWHFYGFDIKNAGDNGMHVTGSHNTFEFMSFYENADTGLQLDNGASYNFVKNSDSYYNADSSLENADGFATKLGVGTGNYFYGCRAWQNLDDGFDGYLRDNDSTVLTTHEYSWMIRNGYQKDGSEGVGDGNGFKTGGSDDKDLAHNGIFINTISAENTADGYDQNSNRGKVTIYNAIAYKNSRNYGLGDSGDRALATLIIKNSISLDGDKSDQFDADATSIKNNSWQNVSTSSADFISMDIDDLLSDRQADGSLPEVEFFHLNSDSDLIDMGTDVGLDYNGSAPDIGSFESE